ncbi:fumarylacetoacetate hydrolase family protein [Sneathiella aquimaris]|uniref:fumarylacetoacetate hydrolase family protein n=1 Tax=Sneathiella aquimaris TaxID=2599305 RepID=UPI00146B2A45|nr:fumarylacetoacetate hydrolase family protein [Sneathiella aquimaris]
MRFLRFKKDGETVYGLLEGAQVYELTGSIFSDYKKTGEIFELEDVELDIPVVPRTFYAAGLNYQTHLEKMSVAVGLDASAPGAPDIGYRANNALTAHNEPVVIPADATDQVHYEGELVVVIGKQGKYLTPETAMDIVFGYTIGNDISERSWQKSDKTMWRSKNTDTFKPMGPWIETDVDLKTMETIVRLNGKEQICFQTNRMITGIVPYLVHMTNYLTLYPGDVIWMGTEGTSPNLLDGDVVEVELTGIGTLRNPVIRQTP